MKQFHAVIKDTFNS